jgi:hypothetical protein
MANVKKPTDKLETIHEEKKRVKREAKKVLKEAKKQEQKKIKVGYRYVKLSNNTWVLKKNEDVSLQ